MIMEEKKFDKQSIIGFLLIGAILLFMLWQNQPTPEELAAEKAKQEQVEAKEKANEAKKKKDTFETTASDYSNTSAADSLKLLSLKNKLSKHFLFEKTHQS